MAVYLGELEDALKEAGASPEKARAAAAAIAGYENRFSSIESTQRLHSWMLTTVVALQIATLIKLLLS
jgi:hypothetical protein